MLNSEGLGNRESRCLLYGGFFRTIWEAFGICISYGGP